MQQGGLCMSSFSLLAALSTFSGWQPQLLLMLLMAFECCAEILHVKGAKSACISDI